MKSQDLSREHEKTRDVIIRAADAIENMTKTLDSKLDEFEIRGEVEIVQTPPPRCCCDLLEY